MSANGGVIGGAATGPLAGVRVIDLTANILGPVATQILGDMGADVIKVEEPKGDYTRHVGTARHPGMGVFFLNTNRNKRSVVLNLKQEESREALRELIRGADVFIHSMRRGAIARLGFSYEEVAAINPNIIYASAAGYRHDKERAEWPAFDDVIQGASGLADLNRDLDGAPRYLATVICDKLCGYILASATGMALYAREKTGKGQEVHVPMLESMVEFNMLEHLWNGSLAEPDLGLGYTRMLSPKRKPYATADGYICLLANTDQQWQRFFEVMGRHELKGDPRFATITPRGQNINELYSIVEEELAKRTTAEWHALLDAADIPNGKVNSLREVFDDPYLNESGFFVRSQHPSEGPMVSTNVSVAFSETPGSLRRLAPRLGEHTDEVLREIGLADDAIARIAKGAKP